MQESIIDCDRAVPGQIRIRQQNVRHEVDDITAREVRSGFLSERLREPLDQILEHIAAVHGADLIRTKIALLRIEFLDDEVKRVALDHAVDDRIEVKFCKHVLHIGRESSKVVTEIRLDVIGICTEQVEGVFAGVVELVAGRLRQEAVDDCKALLALELLQNSIMRRQQTVVEALHDRHRQDDKSVFMRFEWSAQHVCHIPDHGRFFSDVGSDYCKSIVCHCDNSPKIVFLCNH